MTDAEAFLAREGVIPGARWTPKRKAALLQAMKTWPSEADALLQTHGISAPEIAAWRRANAAEGLKGLAANNVAPRERRVVTQDPDGNLHGTGVVIASADASRVRPEDCTPRQREILFGKEWKTSLDSRSRH